MKGVTLKTWTSSYSPAQGELENLGLVAVDPRIRKLLALVYIMSKQSYVINFAFTFKCSEEG